MFNNIGAVIISRDKDSIIGTAKRINKRFVVDQRHDDVGTGGKNDSDLVKDLPRISHKKLT